MISLDVVAVVIKIVCYTVIPVHLLDKTSACSRAGKVLGTSQSSTVVIVQMQMIALCAEYRITGTQYSNTDPVQLFSPSTSIDFFCRHSLPLMLF